MRKLVVFVLIALLASAVSFAGTFKDRDGGLHSWTIDHAHTLNWDGKPYIPVALQFEPRYLGEQTDDNLEADSEDIQAFKLAGAEDVIIKPTKAISSIPPEAFQKIVDLLEANELRYGIELYDPEYSPLPGYVVEPTANRSAGVQISGDMSYRFPGAVSVVYAICDARTGEVRGTGQEAVTDGQVTIHVTLRAPGEHVVLLYPQKMISPADSGLFDIWSDYDNHRDRLVWYLTQIKLGKGLRFLIDPFTESLGVRGEADGFVPISPAFRFEYAAWLSRKYGAIGDLTTAWGVLQHDVANFDEAARLIPLWRKGRGAPLVHDDGNSLKYPVDAMKTAIWTDLQEFRDTSLRGYMDSLADAVKRTAADVPIVFTASGLQSFFQTSGSVGFDGLAGPGGKSEISAGQAFSLADLSTRRMWLIARLKPSGDVFAKKQDLFSAINLSRDLGAKGFIANDEKGINGANLVIWLAEYSGLTANDAHFAGYRPQAMYYPEGVANASIKRLSNGSWWLPSLMPGSNLYIGSGFAGYVVNGQGTKPDVYIWSLKGPQTIHLVAQVPVSVANVSGARTDLKAKKGRVEISVGEEPLLVQGLTAEEFLPVEVVAAAVQELEKTIAKAGQKRMDTGDYVTKLKNAKTMLEKNQLALCLALVQETSAELNQRLRGLEVMPSSATPLENK